MLFVTLQEEGKNINIAKRRAGKNFDIDKFLFYSNLLERSGKFQ